MSCATEKHTDFKASGILTEPDPGQCLRCEVEPFPRVVLFGGVERRSPGDKPWRQRVFGGAEIHELVGEAEAMEKGAGKRTLMLAELHLLMRQAEDLAYRLAQL